MSTPSNVILTPSNVDQAGDDLSREGGRGKLEVLSPARVRIVEAEEQVGHRGLAATAGSNECGG